MEYSNRYTFLHFIMMCLIEFRQTRFISC